MLFHIYSQHGLSTLEDNILVAVQLRSEVHWVLHLDERAELGVEILEQIVALGVALDSRVAARDADVISDANIRFLASAYFDQRLVLGVDNIEYFLAVAVQALKYDVVFFRLINLNDVDYAVVVSNLEGKHLLAKLAVHLLELNDDLAPVDLH